MELNKLKQENYAEQAIRLKKALKYEFYVEALAIEYAMIEDRINSIINTVGLKTVDKYGNNLTINKRLNIIKSNNPFCKVKFLRSKLPVEFVEEIREWKDKRNTIIHSLMTTEFQSGEFRELAEQGNNLRKQIDNKSKSIKKYMAKINKE